MRDPAMHYEEHDAKQARIDAAHERGIDAARESLEEARLNIESACTEYHNASGGLWFDEGYDALHAIDAALKGEG